MLTQCSQCCHSECEFWSVGTVVHFAFSLLLHFDEVAGLRTQASDSRKLVTEWFFYPGFSESEIMHTCSFLSWTHCTKSSLLASTQVRMIKSNTNQNSSLQNFWSHIFLFFHSAICIAVKSQLDSSEALATMYTFMRHSCISSRPRSRFIDKALQGARQTCTTHAGRGGWKLVISDARSRN